MVPYSPGHLDDAPFTSCCDELCELCGFAALREAQAEIAASGLRAGLGALGQRRSAKAFSIALRSAFCSLPSSDGRGEDWAAGPKCARIAAA